MTVRDVDIVNECRVILESVPINMGEGCFITSYQIWTLLNEQNNNICQELVNSYGGAVGNGGGCHVGPAQRIGQALGRSEDIETHYLDTRRIRFVFTNGDIFGASGNHCGLFRLRD